MVGRGSRKDDVPNLSSTNGFAALESLRKKKKPDNSKSKGPSKNQVKEPEQPVFWAPAPITSKKWADVEDEDDDDYYATTAPLNEGWGLPVPQQTTEDDVPEEETESEDDIGIDDGDDDVEDEVENEPKVPVPSEPDLKKPPLAASTTKETERQLSKKEQKRKEDEEFAAALAELGISSKDNSNGGQDGSSNIMASKKTNEQNGENEKKDNPPATSESKISKKKKAKKDKTSMEAKDLLEQRNDHDTNTPDEALGTQPADKDAPAADVKERIKKIASVKKKKSSKDMDTAAKAAVQEAATRNARVASSKRKDKNHYNQQPTR